jgi:hypothetical protein
MEVSKYSDIKKRNSGTLVTGSSIISIYHADQTRAVGIIPKVCQENIVSMVFSSSD